MRVKRGHCKKGKIKVCLPGAKPSSLPILNVQVDVDEDYEIEKVFVQGELEYRGIQREPGESIGGETEQAGREKNLRAEICRLLRPALPPATPVIRTPANQMHDDSTENGRCRDTIHAMRNARCGLFVSVLHQWHHFPKTVYRRYG